MDSSDLRSDDAVLEALGARLAAARLSRDRTQADLADDAGVSKRTVERLEAGQSAQLTSLIRVLRALDLLDRLEDLLPPPRPEPMDLLRREGRAPRRASGTRGGSDGADGTEPFTWAED